MTSYRDHEIELLMEQEARQLLEARMLPSDGPLTPQQRDDVRQSALAYIKRHKIVYTDVARQIGGVTATVINQVLNASYKAKKDETIDGHLRDINSWMEIDARRRGARSKDKFVQIRIAKRIIGCANRAIQGPFIAVAHGPSGIGKTCCADYIGLQFPGSMYLRISSGETSAMAVRKTLAESLMLHTKKRQRSSACSMTLNQRIFAKLRGSGRLLIVDEAHRISDSALEFLRDLFDECDLPILLLCTKDLLERLRRDADEDHGQLYSRVGQVCELVGGFDKIPGGKKPAFTLSEIRQIFTSDKIKLHPDAEGYLMDVANMLGQGSLRRCKWIMKWAIAIERAHRSIGPTVMMTLSADVLRKAETDPMADRSMLDDIQSRVAPTPRTARAQ